MTATERKTLLVKVGFDANITDEIVKEIWDAHLIKFYATEEDAKTALKGWGKKGATNV